MNRQKKSVYERRTFATVEAQGNSNRNWFVANITEFAFKVPAEGLPPIFRVAESPLDLFISHEARLQLKEAKIPGIEYESLKGDRYGEVSSEVDTPIILAQN